MENKVNDTINNKEVIYNYQFSTGYSVKAAYILSKLSSQAFN